MGYNECLEKRIIKVNPLTKSWIDKEIKSAEQFLSEAKTIYPTGCCIF